MVEEDIQTELKRVNERVLNLLTEEESTRNDDNLLIERYYSKYENKVVQLSQVNTPISSILRVRRKIQSSTPELIPTDENIHMKRQRRSQSFRILFGKQKQREEGLQTHTELSLEDLEDYVSDSNNGANNE